MNQGAGNTTVVFCFFNPACIPTGGYPNLFPDALDPNDPLVFQGPFDTNYDDPALRNPRVMNTTATLEVALNDKYTFATTLEVLDREELIRPRRPTEEEVIADGIGVDVGPKTRGLLLVRPRWQGRVEEAEDDGGVSRPLIHEDRRRLGVVEAP